MLMLEIELLKCVTTIFVVIFSFLNENFIAHYVLVFVSCFIARTSYFNPQNEL